MKLSMLMMINLSMISPILKHPISLGFMLIIQTMMICLNMSIYTQTSWYSFILFIIMIGGMMIMFIYMASIASNEKFKFNNFIMKLTILMLIIYMLNWINDQTMEISSKMIENKFSMTEQEEQKSTSKFFNLNKSNLSIMTMLMILLTMISVTNISTTFEGPLKKTYV
uniref:NADH dehydrogenase subunit 6 n=1 Tax=Suva longipenna TaxID=3081115 RepID=UPI002A8196B5|nr:NADH dehydrogenase subunit 6 [Suva longipenna]WOW98941.1 NADH dehydrogenase subunit 6 [Suva longipenna]